MLRRRARGHGRLAEDAGRASDTSWRMSAGRRPPLDPDELAESRALLSWMADRHFTFLGYRHLRPGRGRGRRRCTARGAGHRPRHAARRILATGTVRTRASDLRRAARRDSCAARASRACSCSRRRTVARRCTARRTSTTSAYAGSTPDGKVIGEHRFLGLYTSSAYNSNPIDVPVLRRKVAAIVARAGFLPASHDQKDLIAILETYPRDDLFQIDVDSAATRSRWGSCACRNAGRCGCSSTAELYGRFVSCIVFLPRDRYTTPVRVQHRDDPHRGVPRDESRVERPIDRVGARPTALRLARRPSSRASCRSRHVGVRASRRRRVRGSTTSATHSSRRTARRTRSTLVRLWGDAFPAAYRDDFDAAEAIADLAQLERLDETRTLAVRLTPSNADAADLKLYGIGAQPSLSDVLPAPHQHGRRRRRRAAVRRHAARSATSVGSSTSGSAYRPHAIATAAIGDAVRGGVPRGAPPASRGRRLQPPRARGRVERGAKRRCSARTAGTSARSGRRYSQALHRGRVRRAPRHRARASSSCSSTRLDPWLATAGRHRPPRRPSSRPRSTRSRASTRTASCAACCTSCSRRCAPTGSRPACEATTLARAIVLKLDPGAHPRPAASPADVRDLRVFATRRRRAPAGGAGRARRHPLVGSPRGLPHRGARAHEGAARQERRHRAERREGRLRRQAAARSIASALTAEVEACYRAFIGALLDVTDNLRRRRRRPAGPSRPLRRRRPVPRGRGRQGHRDVLRHRQRDRDSNAASGSATRSRRAARPATTTRRWASPHAARGSR